MKNLSVKLFLCCVFIGIVSVVVSCSFFNEPEFKNKGEVGDQLVYLSNYDESGCAFKGMDAILYVKKGQKFPHLYFVHSKKWSPGAKYLALKEEATEVGVLSNTATTYLGHEKENVYVYPVFASPLNVNWVGQRTYTLTATTYSGKPKEDNSNMLKTVTLSFEVISSE